MLMVKESKEFEREFTIEEECVYSISIDCSYISQIRNAAKEHLASIGFVAIVSTNYNDDYTHHVAKFKIGEDRKATINESRAYYYLKTFSEWCNTTLDECKDCLFTNNCISTGAIRDRAHEIVKGLEFYESDEE